MPDKNQTRPPSPSQVQLHIGQLKKVQVKKVKPKQVGLGVLPLDYLLGTQYVKVDQKWRRS